MITIIKKLLHIPLQNRKEALEATNKMLNALKFNEDRTRSIDDTIEKLMKSSVHIHYLNRQKGK